jgi:hypothetical protein
VVLGGVRTSPPANALDGATTATQTVANPNIILRILRFSFFSSHGERTPSTPTAAWWKLDGIFCTRHTNLNYRDQSTRAMQRAPGIRLSRVSASPAVTETLGQCSKCERFRPCDCGDAGRTPTPHRGVRRPTQPGGGAAHRLPMSAGSGARRCHPAPSR